MTGSKLDRRALLAAGIAAAPLVVAADARAKTAQAGAAEAIVSASVFGLAPSAERDQSKALQRAIDACAAQGSALQLPAGVFVFGKLELKSGTRLMGAFGATILRYSGIGVGLFADRATAIRLEHLTVDGGRLPLDAAQTKALIQFTECSGVALNDVRITESGAHGVYLARSAGVINDCHIDHAADAGLLSLDADVSAGSLTVRGGSVSDCADNGILIWRTEKGHDGSRVVDVRIQRISNRSGGTGQWGNGVNVYRASDVSISGCRISDCSYSAIRANSADMVEMRGNRAERIGEVALYAEFSFQGAVIASNVIDDAATGIAVTNFNEGGRLAVIEGNLIRNLKRRDFEKVDKRGEGIAVEADATITGNVIEDAPTAGLLIGWGPHLRDVVATGNLIRRSRIGIAVSGVAGAGNCLIANNLISGAKEGGIRAMDHGRLIGGDLMLGSSQAHVALAGNVAR